MEKGIQVLRGVPAGGEAILSSEALAFVDSLVCSEKFVEYLTLPAGNSPE